MATNAFWLGNTPRWPAYIEYLKANSENFIRPAKGYGDWLSINADTPKDLLATAYFAHDADLMSQIAWIIGKPDDAAKYRDSSLRIFGRRSTKNSWKRTDRLKAIRKPDICWH